MPTMPPPFRANGVRGRQAADLDRRSSRQRGYSSSWDSQSALYRKFNPVCRYCEIGAFGEPRSSSTDLTDHLYPQQDYPQAFWLRDLWVSCCTPCHSGPKQALEHQGIAALDRLARQLGLPTLAEAMAGRGRGG